MSRYLINQQQGVDPDARALLDVAKLATLVEAAVPTTQYITAIGNDTLQIDEGCIFSIGGSAVIRTNPAVLSAASNLDTGTSFEAGKDYYIYVCDPGGDGNEVYMISKNATYPAGFSATTSRKIGGFHYGKKRRVNASLDPVNTSDAVKGSGWESAIDNAILPRSVWTLKHRPKCSPEGMVLLTSGVWVDIYQASDDGAGGLQSKIGQLPLTGTEGLNWYNFVERALKSGKRLLSYAEWTEAAYGSPQGTDGDNVNAWTKTTNTARTTTGAVDRAVSSIGCRDCVGNVFEWLDELVVRWDSTSPSWAYRDVLGAGNGKAYMLTDTALVALIAGGHWTNGVSAGCRCVGTSYCPWNVGVSTGSRCGSDSL
jgi:hypothetical protein